MSGWIRTTDRTSRGRSLRRPVLVVFFACASVLARGAGVIPENELARPPTPSRVHAVMDSVGVDGWTVQSVMLRQAAFEAYRSGNLQVARAWLNLDRWVRLLGEPESLAVLGWIKAVQTAKVAHSNLPRDYALRKGATLSVWMSRKSQEALANDQAFLDAFFGQLNPCDYPPRVLEILSRLHDADPTTFHVYRNLAVAIALVYDTPPPPWWPHAQVDAGMLRRAWPDPLASFRFFVGQDAAGRCYQPLRSLTPEELKFVVDAAASFDELRWSQAVVDLPLDRLDRAYSMIRYRIDRLKNGRAVWPEPSYSLPRILGYGGICVDQAYFACEVGKARGVPTLLFQGSGMDGRHAWFGYLGPGREWRLDAGRYADQRLVTGAAIDPQTWGWLTDHDLRFLTERFQGLESTRQSRTETDFAEAFLEANEVDQADHAVENALKAEPRNISAWTLALEISRRRGASAETTETIYRRAMHAFVKYPDLEAHFADLLVASLRSRGQASMADYEQTAFVRRFGRTRTDLAIREASAGLVRSFTSTDLEAQMAAYRRIVDQFADNGGMTLFDAVVRVFVEHLATLGNREEALKALTRARAVMHVVDGTPLAREFDALEKRVRDQP